MKAWGYGNINENTPNPIYDEFTIGSGCTREFELENCRVIQISYITNNPHTVLIIKKDEIEQKINNSYCLEEVSDTRGIGYIQQEKFYVENKPKWRVTCLIPIIFEKKGKIILASEQGEAEIRGLHIYYLI